MNAPAFSASSASIRSITPESLGALLRSGKPCAIVDVRTPAEFQAAHVTGTHAIPLHELKPAALAPLAIEPGSDLYLLCQSGGRARRAAEQLAAAGVTGCTVVEGGLDAWMAAGLPVERGSGTGLSLMRQVQIVIGLVSGVGAALAIWKHPLFGWIPLLTGAGLLFAGLTGTCGLALLLARMPWNQRSGPLTASTSPSKTASSKAASCCAGGAQ